MSADIGFACRALACKRWRWMAGMLARGRSDVHFGTPPCSFRLIVDHVARWVSNPLPDLADPATLGCLLVLVREVWGDPLLVLVAEYDLHGELWWSVNSVHRRNDDLRACGLGRSEAEALVEALESCP